jgi:hypothetical protein
MQLAEFEHAVPASKQPGTLHIALVHRHLSLADTQMYAYIFINCALINSIFLDIRICH